MRKLEMNELNRKSVDEFRASQKIPVVVILDNVRSMHNVGSVFRTADAFLLEGIILCGYTPRPPHRDIHKTALGATETVDWKYFENTLDAVKKIKEDGYAIWAVEQVEGSIDLDRATIRNNKLKKEYLDSVELGEKIAVIFGNEVSGVDGEVLKLCDGSLEIPQSGMKHSLNISVAAGIVLWHLFREYLKS